MTLAYPPDIERPPGGWDRVQGESTTPNTGATMKRMFALALIALFATACAPGQLKRWSNPGHHKGAATAP